jgi:hypothetical protein
LSWWTSDEEHRTGSIFALLFTLGSTLAAVGAALLVSLGTRDHLCSGNATCSDTNDTVCLVQGYMYFIGSLTAAGSACCQCVDLYLRVVMNTTTSRLRWYRRLAFVLFLVFVAYPVLLIAKTNHIGYEVRLASVVHLRLEISRFFDFVIPSLDFRGAATG